MYMCIVIVYTGTCMCNEHVNVQHVLYLYLHVGNGGIFGSCLHLYNCVR